MSNVPKVAVVEVFKAVQGEGYHTGRSAVFVRFTGCNLACEFAPGVPCDTPYMYASRKLTMTELFDEVYQLDPSGKAMVVLTGGEPTLCSQFDTIVDLMKTKGRYVAVETNGTLWRDGLECVDWIAVSPKVDVPQTSKGTHHNHNPRKPALSAKVMVELSRRLGTIPHWLTGVCPGGEYRYVLSQNSPDPFYKIASRLYVSPAVVSDGTYAEDGEEVLKATPQFRPAVGAVERCLRFVEENPEWALSIQTHKVLGIR